MIKLSHFIIIRIIFLLIILFFINTKSLHPISLIIALIFYRIIICLLISIQSFNYIFSIIFFLIIIRGLLIIFLYFARLISNEQNKSVSNISSLTISIIINIIILSIFLINYFIYNYYNFFEINDLFSINIPLFKNIYNIFNYPFNNLTLLCIIYLLIVLFSIIKICSIKSTPIRKLN